jgi:hypothetical protein
VLHAIRSCLGTVLSIRTDAGRQAPETEKPPRMFRRLATVGRASLYFSTTPAALSSWSSSQRLRGRPPP